MKKYLLFINILLLQLVHTSPATAQNSQTVANGQVTAPITIISPCPFTWTNDQPGIGLPASGNGNIPAFTAINNSSTPVTATITITPGSPCASTPTTFTIIVDAAAVITVPTTVIGWIYSCTGTAAASPNIGSFPLSGSILTDDITATAPAGVEISLNAATGFNSTITIPQTAGTANATIYVRTAASAPVGTLTGNITLSTVGATTQNVSVSAVVVSCPITPPTSQTVKNGATTTPINLSCPFTWTNDQPGIGLVASGTGNISAFTAINTGTAPIIADIKIIPQANAYIITDAGHKIDIINTATGAIINRIPNIISGEGIAISKDQQFFYTEVNGGISKYYSDGTLLANYLIGTLLGNYDMLLSADGNTLYVGGVSKILVVNTTNMTLTATIPLATGSNATSMILSPDQSTLYVTDQNTGNVSVINTTTNTVTTTIPVFPAGDLSMGIAISQDGTKLYVTSQATNAVKVLSTATNAVIKTIAEAGGPAYCLLSPDGSKLYVSNSNNNTVSVINTSTDAITNTITVGTGPFGLSFTPDGKQLYVVNVGGNSVSVVNTATNAVTNTIATDTDPINWGNFIGSPCGPPYTYTLTVTPTPAITTTPMTGLVKACVGNASASPNIGTFNVSAINLTTDIIVQGFLPFEVSLSPGSGYASSITIVHTAGTVNNVPVYVRIAASTPVGNPTGSVSLRTTGYSQSVAVGGAVNSCPAPLQTSQTVTNGGSTTPITSSCSFNWTNDQPGIGLPASGTGPISAFTGINTGTTPVTANIKITPVSYAFIPCATGGDIVEINTATGAVINRIAVAPRQATAVSPDQQFVYVQSTTGIAKIRASDGSVLGNYSLSIPIGDEFLVSADGGTLYMTANDGKVYVINTSSMALIATITADPSGNQLTSMIFSPDQSKLYVVESATGSVCVINTTTNTVAGTIPVAPGLVGIAVSPDGARLYVAAYTTNRVYIVNTATNALSNISVPGGPAYCLLSPDGSKLYVSNQTNNTVSVINTTTNAIITNITVGTNPFGLSFTPDGSQLYVSDDVSNKVSVINTATNTVVNTIAVDQFPNPWGNFIASPCGSSYTYTITVNPNNTFITTTPMTGTLYACVTNPSVIPNIGTFSVSGINLSANIVATAPPGFEISLNATTGFGSTLTIPQTAGAITNIPVYVRLAASSTTGIQSGAVILSTTGGASQNVALRGTVGSCSVPPTSQTVTNGQTTTLVPSPGCESTWTNNTPGIGLPATGTDDIPAFTAINTGTTPITATITINPTSLAYLQCSNSGWVDVINTATGAIVDKVAVPNTSYALAASPDGQNVYLKSSSNGLIAIQTSNDAPLTIYFGALPSATDFVLNRGGYLMYMSSLNTNQVFVFSTFANAVTGTINLPGGTTGGMPSDMVLSPDESTLYVTDEKTGKINVINTSTNTVTGSIPFGAANDQSMGINISPDGSKLYVTDQTANCVKVINTATNAIIATISVPGQGPTHSILSVDGTRLYTSNSVGGSVSVINTTNNTVITTIPTGLDPFGLSFTPDGSQLYIVNVTSNKITVLSTATNTIIRTINTDQEPQPWGNFIAAPCGLSYTYAITINPSPVITATTTSGAIQTCVGSASASPNIQTFTVAGSFLTADIIATAPTGFEISLSATSGFGNTVTLTQTAGTVTNVPVYVRSAASDPSGTPTGNVTLSTTGGTSKNVAVVGTINPLITPSISIAASNATICSGAPVTFTATPTNPGTAPIYQWLLNGNPVGTNSTTFTSTTLSSTDQVSCILTSNAACATGPATSNTIMTTVNPPVTPSVSIAASVSTICAGSPVTFTATPTNPGSAPTYQWQLNGNPVGTNSTTFTTTTLSSTDQVNCILTNNAACAGGPATSNTITTTVNPLVTPSISIAPSSATICAGSPVTFTATPTNPGSTPTYQWQLNGNPVGTNNTTFTSTTLSSTDQVNCILTSNATCAAGPATSNAITTTVNALITSSIAISASTNSICAGSPVTFTATPTNPGSAPIYQWQLNGSPIGTNATTFTSTTLSSIDQINCILTSNATCATGPATSNAIMTTVNPLVTSSISIAASNATICTGSPVTFTATPTNPGIAPTYQWQLNGNPTGANSPTFTSTTLSSTDQVNCVLTSNATCATGPATSNTLITTVNPLVTPSISIAPSSTAICAGSPVTFTATPTNAGSAPIYQWQLNGNPTGTNSITFTISTLNNTDQISCVLTSNAACTTGPAATSASIAMTVTQQITPTITITPSTPEVCTGNAVTFTATASNTGSNPNYQWTVNGAPVGTNSPSYTSKAPRDGDQVVCKVTSSQACFVPGTADPVKIIVDLLPTITFSADPVYKGISGIQLDPSINGSITKYEWSPADGLNATDIANPIANPVAIQTYQLQVTTDKNCTASGTVTVITRLPLVMANAFTPNGDGHNDVFRIPPGATLILDQFSVFNRWGTEIFSTRNISIGWDGTYGGQPAPAGAYVYMIKGKDSGGKPLAISGTVMLIR